MATSVLWVDSEHLWAWTAHIEYLKESGFLVETSKDTHFADIVTNCKDKQVLIIHVGTSPRLTVSVMVVLFKVLRLIYPGIKIGLDTQAIPIGMKSSLDFTITKPLSVYDLKDILLNVVSD